MFNSQNGLTSLAQQVSSGVEGMRELGGSLAAIDMLRSNLVEQQGFLTVNRIADLVSHWSTICNCNSLNLSNIRQHLLDNQSGLVSYLQTYQAINTALYPKKSVLAEALAQHSLKDYSSYIATLLNTPAPEWSSVDVGIVDLFTRLPDEALDCIDDPESQQALTTVLTDPGISADIRSLVDTAHHQLKEEEFVLPDIYQQVQNRIIEFLSIRLGWDRSKAIKVVVIIFTIASAASSAWSFVDSQMDKAEYQERHNQLMEGMSFIKKEVDGLLGEVHCIKDELIVLKEAINAEKKLSPLFAGVETGQMISDCQFFGLPDLIAPDGELSKGDQVMILGILE